ncbi:hydroxymethylglutaryl-CoA lyase [Acinetobacter baumannii]|jgi:hydroxymethylglutaryl-CoA lyase|uniref:Hydroxymethylglutaryl-CoA lyase n=1 Tax=Acinetobacter baumannii TaxID=470 RepID=A0A333B0D7_ACIBA|nr:hydroxymethylglutaryl-CoA lyase [Acinetobacter baumannii]EJB8494384.1 hydroxymethylglutaryl-CoA lyase [Acinetobacter baumannii]ELB0343119.1 hydroxymethylglutaryl-CoA lyase [Acinetobacter baumannii]EMC7949636.1 hydroxymethylglutaryl-CoA lyase [Acinetobacter baumannii]EMD9690990.1 hydroxymethylglutaryl-CoA lyase [Acinetobacter baumannii]ETQ99773.1 HMGL-like protein [Acinetobacter baumannii UH6507]
MNSNRWVNIVEVGPRDGLQNEKQSISFDDKIELIQRLSRAGINYLEAGSFVSSKWVPQMAATQEIFSYLKDQSNSKRTYAALVPNLKGLESALKTEVKEIAVFIAASESFSKKNINKSIEEAVATTRDVINEALKHNIKVRGYLSCVLGCPYEGQIDIKTVVQLTKQLIDFGTYEVSLGDTIGVGTPFKTRELIRALKEEVPVSKIAGHFHDTYGQALANVWVSLEEGIRTFDSSIAGLGGCPYAKGASGNLATEDLIYMLHNSGYETGVDLQKLIDAGDFINSVLGRETNSKVAKALAKN